MITIERLKEIASGNGNQPWMKDLQELAQFLYVSLETALSMKWAVRVNLGQLTSY